MMGVVTSKSDQPGLETEGGHVYERSAEQLEADENKTQSVCNEAMVDYLLSEEPGSSLVIPAPIGEESEMMQMLCPVDDDNIADLDWQDIYHQLKTDKSNDLHRPERATKHSFTIGSASSTSSNGGSGLISPRLVITSADDDQPTNIHFNFSSPNIASDCELSPIIDTIFFSDDEDIPASPSNELVVERPAAPTPPLSKEIKELQFSKADGIVSISQLSAAESSGDKHKDDSLFSDDILAPTIEDIDDEQPAIKKDRIKIPKVEVTEYSPLCHASSSNSSSDLSILDDSSWDSFDDLLLSERQRSLSIGSIGSISLGSDKEAQSDNYKEYCCEVQQKIRNSGFYDKFPSPYVLREAQRTYHQMNMSAPVADNGNILAHPPNFCCDDLLTTQTYDAINTWVHGCPEEMTMRGRLPDIVAYLCSGVDDDISKMLAIYTWLAQRQVMAAEGRRHNTETAQGWCKTFRKMCRLAHIGSKLIHGIIRGPTYVPGDDPAKYRGVWVSVLINKTWWVLDPVLNNTEVVTSAQKTQNGRKLQSTPVEHGKQAINTQNFFQDPEEFIFTHFPDKLRWQLLARPVSREEMTDLAVLRSGFFSLRMNVLNEPKSIVIVQSEEIVISLGYPEKCHRQFSCNLYHCVGSRLESETLLISSKSSRKVPLRRYVFLENILNKCKVNVKIKFPKTGPYLLDIYGSNESLKQEPKKLCTYRLVYENDKMSVPYPQNLREEWGPGLDAVRLGLRPVSYHSGEIVIYKGVTLITFKDNRGLQFKCELLKDGRLVPDSADKKMKFLRNKDGDVIFIVELEASLVGLYTLNLFARADTSKPFKNFCNYLVKKLEYRCIEKENVSLFEKRLSVREDMKVIKPQYSGHSYNYKVVESGGNQRITIAPETGQMQLTVGARGISQLLVELKLLDKQTLNFYEHTRHWVEDSTAYIDLNFPRKGKYSLKVLGQYKMDNHFHVIHEDTIQVSVPSTKWSPYPMMLEEWNSFFKIETPLDQHVREKKILQFKVFISGAQDVAVVAPKGWYHLERDEDDVWEGQALTGPRGTVCKLRARFEIGSAKFRNLLNFRVKSDEDIGALCDRQGAERQVAIKDLHTSHRAS